jgi:ABC-type transport system substrate-binding protein
VFASAAKGFIPDAAWNTTRKNSFRENGKNLIASSADLAQAQGLISAANLPADQKTIKIAVRPNEVDILVAETVKAAWEQLGFTVEVKQLKVTEYLNSEAGGNTTEYELLRDKFRDALYEGDFDVIAVDATMLTPQPMSLLATYAMDFCGTATADITANYDVAHLSGYHSLEYDALIEQAFLTESAEERAMVLHRAEELLVNDMPAMPIFVYQNAFLISGELSKMKYDCAGNYNFINLKLKDFEKYLEPEA